MELTRRTFLTVSGAAVTMAALPVLAGVTPTASIVIYPVEPGTMIAVQVADTEELLYTGIAKGGEVTIQHSLPEGTQVIVTARKRGLKNLYIPFNSSANLHIHQVQDQIF